MGMDEAESKESVHKAEQTESRSLIIKAEEEEATPQRGHLGDLSAGQEDVTNGLTSHDSQDANLTLSKPGGSISPVLQAQSVISRVTPSPPTSSIQEIPGPTAQVMERYLNDSLHAWFRQEFLMEYQAEEGRLVCMVCSGLLPSLHLDHIKSHMLDLHPNSLLYSAEEKHSILQTWAKMHGEESHSLQPQIKSEQHTKEINLDGSASFIPLNVDPIQGNLVSYIRGDEHPPDTGQRAQSLPYYPRKRRLKYGSPWRLRLDYLVAYGPPENPLCYCMVCSEHMPVPRVSNFRKHIQKCHPETSSLSRSERDAVVSAWIKEENIDKATPKEDGNQSS
ncbi:uncharacterized protein C11orf95 homolog [Sinocyclocheilus grahami]|uniref:uncharacterized protein C11orf95 homolog n=1 Tax=Sinocyclocheilus grahami TaxID=75366 RepID=UPI0007ACB61D|nr:PREDICTED: uncharacterized protein C11orf95 homolog [Sinocyclocheilus grahami]